MLRALYDYTANSEGELNLREGDSITVYQKDNTGWAHGRNERTREEGQNAYESEDWKAQVQQQQSFLRTPPAVSRPTAPTNASFMTPTIAIPPRPSNGNLNSSYPPPTKSQSAVPLPTRNDSRGRSKTNEDGFQKPSNTEFMDKNLKSGFLYKMSGLSWKKKWCVVRNGSLLIFNNQTDVNPKNDIKLSACSVIEEDKVVKRAFAMHLAHGKKHVCIAADSLHEMEEWLTVLKGKPYTASTPSAASPVPPLSSAAPSTPNIPTAPTPAPIPPAPPLMSPPPSRRGPGRTPPTPPAESRAPIAPPVPPLQKFNSAPTLTASSNAPPSLPSRAARPTLNNGPPADTGVGPRVPRNLNRADTVAALGPSRERMPPPALQRMQSPPPQRPQRMQSPPPIARMQSPPPQRNPTGMGMGRMPPPPPARDEKRLPPNWVECKTDAGETYYWNSVTDESSWEFPTSAPSAAPRRQDPAPKGPKDFKPNLKLKTEGSHASISLPSGFLHTANFTGDEFNWAYEGGAGAEKRGYLSRSLPGLGGGWRDQWFVIRKGQIKFFDSAQDTIPLGTVDLKNSTVEKDEKSGRPFCIHIFTANKQHFILSAQTAEDQQEWISAIKINGASDTQFAKQEQEMRQKEEEKRQAEERKRREKELQKAEEEYIRNKDKILAERKYRQEREMLLADPVTSYCEIRVLESMERDGKLAFKVNVAFASQEWIVYRFDKQFSDLYSNLTNGLSCDISSVKGHFPKKSKDMDMTTLCSAYENFLRVLVNDRATVMGHKKASVYFIRFIAPIQMGDEKPEGFVMPFKIELLS